MTEDEARARVLANVPRETAERLERYHTLLVEENDRQNLIARSTIDHIWSRHILDSAQLLPLAPSPAGIWIDLGAGAGFPGLVIAALSDYSVVLIEPRAKRCAFLTQAAVHMGIVDRVQIIASRAETAPLVEATVISARAVAALPDLFAMGHRFATPGTIWLLMKGRSAAEEVEATHASWHACIELVPSITDPEAAIVVASAVKPRRGRRA